MRKDEPAIHTQSAPAQERGFVATCTVLLVALACSIVVIAAPRPVQPSRLPALRVPLAEGRRAFGDIALDPEQPLPQSAQLARFYELYSEAGLNEREPELDPAMVAEQREELTALVRDELPKVSTRAVIDGLSARALASLFMREPPAEAYGLLGSFPTLLQRYGYVDQTLQPIAPLRVIRYLYQQRFNLICERPVDADLDPFDRALAEGWIALHGEHVPRERRVQAARAFLELEGIDAREALAVWLYYGELTGDAALLLQRAYERTEALRLRNMLLFLRLD